MRYGSRCDRRLCQDRVLDSGESAIALTDYVRIACYMYIYGCAAVPGWVEGLSAGTKPVLPTTTTTQH